MLSFFPNDRCKEMEQNNDLPIYNTIFLKFKVLKGTCSSIPFLKTQFKSPNCDLNIFVPK